VFNSKIFGERVKKLRTDKKISQIVLGENLGIGKSAVSMIESGQRSASIEVADQIANYFKVPLDYLLGRGVFKNWDKVLIYREAICRELLNVLPFLEKTGLDLMALPEPYFMEMLAATVEKIDYKEENSRPCFDITLYPFY